MDGHTSSVQILNGAVDITSLIKWDTLALTMVLTKEKGTLSFDIYIPQSGLPPTNAPILSDTVYMNYTIDGNTVEVFGGTVTAINKTVIGGILVVYSYTCQDWGYILDKQLVVKLYTNMDPADILADIVSQFCPAGFDATTYVQRAGFNIASMKFNYQQPTKAIEQLASQIGWDWYIDPQKKIHFFFAGNYAGTSEMFPAPIVVNDTGGSTGKDIEWSSLTVELDSSNLKNSIYVNGGTYPKYFDATTAIDVYQTTGGTYVYPIAYPYTQDTIVVELDGVAQTVGVDNQTDPTSVQVLVNAGNLFVRFTSDPGSGHTLKVFGYANIPISAHIRDELSISLFGEYQDIISNSQISSVQEAQERATSELVQFSRPVTNVNFTSVSPVTNKLYIGQSITVDSASFGINKSLIVKHIDAKMRTPSVMEFAVQCLGSDKVGFTDIMLYLLQQTNAQQTQPDGTILQVIINDPETIVVNDDTITTTPGSRPYKWGPGSSPIPRWNFFTWL